MVGSVLAISVVNISNNDWIRITNGWISSGNQCSRGVGYYTQLVWQVNNRHGIQTTRQTIHWIQTRKQTTVMSAAGVKMIAQRRQDQDVFVWNDQKLKCTDIQYISWSLWTHTTIQMTISRTQPTWGADGLSSSIGGLPWVSSQSSSMSSTSQSSQSSSLPSLAQS